MSNYAGTAIHPETGKEAPCVFVDNFFGPHSYGVQFEGEDRVRQAQAVIVDRNLIAHRAPINEETKP